MQGQVSDVIRRRADIEEDALFVSGRAGVADAPAMEDEHMGKVIPPLARSYGHKVLLYLHGVGPGRKPEPLGEPLYMCVHGNALIYTVDV